MEAMSDMLHCEVTAAQLGLGAGTVKAYLMAGLVQAGTQLVGAWGV